MVYESLPKEPIDETPSNWSDRGSEFGDFKYRCRLQRLAIANIFLLFLVLGLLSWLLFAQIHGPSKPLLTKIQYGSNVEYMSLNHKYDYLWNEQAVEKAGAVVLSIDSDGNPSEYGAISMFHQLHCLASFRKILQKAREGKIIVEDYTMNPHWPHCFYYMRQTILCSADAQIEREVTVNGSKMINGANDWRQCKDSQSVYELFENGGGKDST